MSSPKQMMDFKSVKSVDANVSNEHQRNWNDELFERKAKNPDHNYDRSRTALNFQVGPGGEITTVGKSQRIGDKVEEIIKKHLRPDARVTAISNRAVMVVFGGNRERMREMAFGSQELNEYEETNGHLIRQPEIERWAKDVSELRCRIASLETQLETTGQKLADKRDKLKLADRQLAELQDELDALSEKRDNAQKNFHEFTEKNQEQVRMRLTDAVFGRLIVDIRELFAAMPSEQKADLDGEFLAAIAEQPNEILKCAMYLFLGYLDGASQFAQSCGGGGSDTSLPWSRKEDEDDRRFAYRCMMQAHKMLKPSQLKLGVCGKRQEEHFT